MSEDLIGKMMGKYELRERIGRGGMAEVYKAYHASLDRFVALKVLHPFLGEDSEFKERFEREARNVAQLRHPNIVQVYDFDLDPGPNLYYMVMEHIDGPTLRTYLMQRSFENELVSIEESIRITRDLASALAYAHSREMIHRDIKPSNIMLDSDGRVVLTDFGIARIVSGPHMTASGSMVGTPSYMSPEQGLGQSGDHRSDIYSLGVVLYQLVTGTTPYDADTPIAIILKHVNDPLPPPTSLNPDIPEGLELIIYKALAKSPEERYSDVEDMVRHLNNIQEAAGLLVKPPGGKLKAEQEVQEEEYPALNVPAVEEVPESRRNGCLTWIMMGVISLLAMAVGIYLAFTGILSSMLPILPSAELMLTNTPTPIATETLATENVASPTPDMQATAFSLTVEALATVIATHSDITATPDLTATSIACDYDYEVISEDPENLAPYPELTTLTKTITIVNDSQCVLDDDIRFVFVDGFQLEGPEYIEFNKALEPGEQFEIILNLRTPALNPNNPIVRSEWALFLPDGTQVGPPFVIELTLVLSTDQGSDTGDDATSDDTFSP